MCTECGCSAGPDKGYKLLSVETDLLNRNRRTAHQTRAWLAQRQVVALNLLSSPGAGKTAILERTLRELGGQIRFQVVEGDQATRNDADRIEAAGGQVVQLNTGTGCHLGARQVQEALQQLDPAPGTLCFIENVGNLVCPALFDLGENAKVVILSLPEGEDKPVKYPHCFKESQLMLLNKMDLLEPLGFDMERCLGYARQVNPELVVLPLSARSGQGLTAWYEWLGQRVGQRVGV